MREYRNELGTADKQGAVSKRSARWTLSMFSRKRPKSSHTPCSKDC